MGLPYHNAIGGVGSILGVLLGVSIIVSADPSIISSIIWLLLGVSIIVSADTTYIIRWWINTLLW